MKVNRCPNCESDDLGDRWQKGRRLQQFCYDCNWIGSVRIPEKIDIELTRYVNANHFPGFHYHIFDQFGHTMTSSQSFRTEAEAIAEMEAQMQRSNRNPHGNECLPLTGVVWPDKVIVHGKKFVLENNKVKHV